MKKHTSKQVYLFLSLAALVFLRTQTLIISDALTIALILKVMSLAEEVKGLTKAIEENKDFTENNNDLKQNLVLKVLLKLFK